MKLENRDVKIVIGKNGVTETEQTSVQTPVQSNVRTPEVEQIVSEAKLEAAPSFETVEKETIVVEAKQEANTGDKIVTIKAEMTGIFYAQSEPGAAPYVQVGDTVQADTTVGLIEIMKVYRALTAGVAGVITQVLVEDADLIEEGQPLFSVKVN